MATSIGYCISCTSKTREYPIVKETPGGNCLEWQPETPTTNFEVIEIDPSGDFFKNAKELPTVTKVLGG
jgi:hypothetical protein